MRPVENCTADLEPQPQPSVDYLARLAFHSFKHAQAKPHLQTLMYDYIKTIRPDWLINDDLMQEVHARTLKYVAAYLDKAIPAGLHTEVDANDPKKREIQVEGNVAAMQRSFNNPQIPDARQQLFMITHTIIDRDYRFLENGRMPFFVQFGVLGKSTGMSEYDSLYRDIVSTVQNPAGIRFRGDLTEKAGHLVGTWNKKNPDKAVRFPLPELPTRNA